MRPLTHHASKFFQRPASKFWSCGLTLRERALAISAFFGFSSYRRSALVTQRVSYTSTCYRRRCTAATDCDGSHGDGEPEMGTSTRLYSRTQPDQSRTKKMTVHLLLLFLLRFQRFLCLPLTHLGDRLHLLMNRHRDWKSRRKHAALVIIQLSPSYSMYAYLGLYVFHAFMFMYVWLYVCMYACMYACMRECMTACMHVRKYVCSYLYAYACMLLCSWANM